MVNGQESIQTDRPDQTESPAITPKNHLQIETGVFYEKTDRDSENFSHPTVLWKYGINENFELRMITEFNSEKMGSNRNAGVSPLSLGFKTRLSEEKNMFRRFPLWAISLSTNWLQSLLKPLILPPPSGWCFSILYPIK